MNALSGKFGVWGLITVVAGTVTALNPSTVRAEHCGPQLQQAVAALNRSAEHLAEEIQFDLSRTAHFAHLQQDSSELVEATQTAPGDDLVSALIDARDGEERLNQQEHLDLAGGVTRIGDLLGARHQTAFQSERWASRVKRRHQTPARCHPIATQQTSA